MTGTIKALALAGSLGLAGTTAVGVAASGPLHRLARIHHEFEQMNLSAEQKHEVHGILRAHKDEARAASDRLWQARQAIDEAVRREPIDEAVIRQRAADAASASVELALLHAKVRGEVRGVLTPEQNAKAEEIHAEIRDGIGELRQMARAFVDEHLNED